MNSMFGKHIEPLTSSERLKKKRNLEIYKSLVTSSNKKKEKVCLDKDNNVRNAINYESYMNVVDGFYENIKKNSSCCENDKNANCFNVYLKDDASLFKINTFDDVNNSFIDFENASVVYDSSENGIGSFTKWIPGDGSVINPAGYFEPDTDSITGDINEDKGFFVEAVKGISGSTSTFFQKGAIEKSSKIIYPYDKKGTCAKLIIPKLTFFDPNGNSGGKVARDIKYFFPMSKLSKYNDKCE